jgi:hypothetical protein
MAARAIIAAAAGAAAVLVRRVFTWRAKPLPDVIDARTPVAVAQIG